MNITKIEIKNLFGIKEYRQEGQSVELSGTNGAGKTSVLDAIKYALTNKSTRDYILHKGEQEGEIIVETDTGLSIDRKVRWNKADYKSVKMNGAEVNGPEAFLRDLFTPLQLNPIEFMNMDKKQQNAIILDMIEYPWDMNKIREWFGEIPAWVNYEQNILSVLNDIQSENGEYYQNRRNIDRDIRNKKAFVEDIAASLPSGYEADKWRNANVGDIYREIERITHENSVIEKAQQMLDNRNNKMRKFQADLEIEKAAIESELGQRAAQITEEITRLEGQIATLRQEQSGLESKKTDKIQIAESNYKASVAAFESECAEYEPYAGKELQDTTKLQQKAKSIEDMKAHLNEYDRMVQLQNDISELQAQSQDMTDKIEKARTLPGEILANCTIPINGLTVENGIPLIHGLPVSNLSEGEKLDLCIDVAVQKPNALNIILIDGAEKLASDLREKLYAKCKEKGLQFIATRTTDENKFTIIEF